MLPCGCSEKKQTKTTVQAEERFQIRVLLLDNTTGIKLHIKSPFEIQQPQNRNATLYFNRIDEPLDISIAEGTMTVAGWSCPAGELLILPQDPYIFNLNGSDYRGSLQLIAHTDGKTFDVINQVPLESYLAGVVGAEMPAYWEPEALKAQTIASRTYCLYIKKRFGVNRSWDVTRTQSNQVYNGIRAESRQVWKAVEQTNGQVLTSKYPDGTEDIFPAYFASSCGGHTENSANVFGGENIPALEGVPCPYCQYTAKSSSFYWPQAEVNKITASQKLVAKYPNLENLGTITDLIPIKQSDYKVNIDGGIREFSRLFFFKLAGSTGNSNYIRAEDLRNTLDPTGLIIKSTIFKIASIDDKWVFYEGRGWGHGAGLCQCGAQALARMERKDGYQILSYYYPGSQIKYVY